MPPYVHNQSPFPPHYSNRTHPIMYGELVEVCSFFDKCFHWMKQFLDVQLVIAAEYGLHHHKCTYKHCIKANTKFSQERAMTTYPHPSHPY